MEKNKKIGIVTLHGYVNYGNKLQNYALKHIINGLGFETVTTIINDKSLEKKYLVKKIFLVFKISPQKYFKKIIKKMTNKDKKQIEKSEEQIERENKFRLFSKEYLNEKFYEVSNLNDNEQLKNFSFFITGSDQVWSPSEFNKLPIFFLTFIEKPKRIAYSPSIGRDTIPAEYKSDYKKWLEGISKISIREETGAKIINDIANIEAPILVDPTMLLNKEQWLSVSKKATNRLDSPYVLTYFLGGPSSEAGKKIAKLADEHGMGIINLGDIDEKETYKTGPSEFIDYIDNASAFFTDSFHGVVFSIILQTPFIVYKREASGSSMYSRIETLLDRFSLRNREIKNFDEDIFSMDFSRSINILEQEYERSIKYLENAIGVDD